MMPLGTLWGGAGKLLILSGLALTLLGIVLYLLGRYMDMGQWRGLPGDLALRVGGITVYLPLATCIALSVLLSVVLTAGFYLAALLRR